MKICRKAETSLAVTCPSAFAIFAPSAMTAIVKAIVRSGGDVSFSRTADNDSPSSNALIASPILVQIDILFSFHRLSVAAVSNATIPVLCLNVILTGTIVRDSDRKDGTSAFFRTVAEGSG